MSWLNSVQRTRYFFQKSRITRHDHNLLSHLLHTSTQGNTTIQTSLSVTALYTDIRCKLQTKCSSCWATGWGRECVLLEQVLVYVLKASKQTHVHVNGDSGSVQDLHLASKHLRHAVSGRIWKLRQGKQTVLRLWFPRNAQLRHPGHAPSGVRRI